MNENHRKVSICIPTYNNVIEVERLLKSIYIQQYTDFEVNLSDDSTNDEIAQLVQTQYPQVNYVQNSKPLGHILNWNAAIKMAKGEYIKIMFSDDWFTDQNSLGVFASMLDNNPDAMLAFSGSRQVMLDEMPDAVLASLGSEQAVKEGRRHYYDRCAEEEFIARLKKDYRLLFLGNQIGAPSAVIYRRGGELTLFDEQSNWASDMYLYFDLLIKSHIFAYTKEPLVSIGVHAHQYTESFTEKDMRIYQDYRYMYTKYKLCESAACREYFTEKFLIKYHQSMQEAKMLGISSCLYWKKYFAELLESVCCFVRHRLKILSEKDPV